jgi:hypothetical protein
LSLKPKRLLDSVNLIDYMLVIFCGGNLDTPISWLGNSRRGNSWHGLINRAQNKGFQEDQLGPSPLGDATDRSNSYWLYQRLLENEEFHVNLNCWLTESRSTFSAPKS